MFEGSARIPSSQEQNVNKQGHVLRPIQYDQTCGRAEGWSGNKTGEEGRQSSLPPRALPGWERQGRSSAAGGPGEMTSLL